MTAAVVDFPSRPVTARRSSASFATQTWLEIRKSVSTRSGMAVVAASVLIAPVITAIVAAAAKGPLDSVAGPIVVTGMLSALALVSLGVLSTAGEWTHGTVQTTYLLEPRRSRVLAAKAVAVGVMGAVIAAVAVALTSGVLAVMEPSASWSGAGRAIAMVAVAGAAFSLMGAGVGAALGNTPGALTGLYLVNLGVLPLLETFKPELAHKIDPGNAVLDLAQAQHQGQAVTILAVWVGAALLAGAVMTRRRAVQ